MTAPQKPLSRRPPSGRPSPRLARTPAVVGAVALGGAAGAAARYAASLARPSPPGAFPWTTLWVNVAGCAVIGVFMVLVTEIRTAHPLVRPFFGTGVLGGFTTFSTYAVDVQKLFDGGRAASGLAYLAATPLAALAAVWLAAAATRSAAKAATRSARPDGEAATTASQAPPPGRVAPGECEVIRHDGDGDGRGTPDAKGEKSS